MAGGGKEQRQPGPGNWGGGFAAARFAADADTINTTSLQLLAVGADSQGANESAVHRSSRVGSREVFMVQNFVYVQILTQIETTGSSMKKI